MSPDEQQLRRLEKQRCAALTSGDVKSLATLMADDLVHIHGNGRIDRLAEYLDGVATKYVFHRIERGELDIRLYSNAAVVVGPLDQTVEIRGDDKRKEIKAIVSQTWVRKIDGWKQNTCHMHFLSVT